LGPRALDAGPQAGTTRRRLTVGAAALTRCSQLPQGPEDFGAVYRSVSLCERTSQNPPGCPRSTRAHRRTGRVPGWVARVLGWVVVRWVTLVPGWDPSWDGGGASRGGRRPRTRRARPRTAAVPGQRLLVARRVMSCDATRHLRTRPVLGRRSISRGPVLPPTCSKINVWTYRGVPLGEIDASDSFWNTFNTHSIISGTDIPSFLLSAVSSRMDGL